MVLIRTGTTYDPHLEAPAHTIELPFIDEIGRGRAFYSDIRAQLLSDMYETRVELEPDEEWRDI